MFAFVFITPRIVVDSWYAFSKCLLDVCIINKWGFLGINNGTNYTTHKFGQPSLILLYLSLTKVKTDENLPKKMFHFTSFTAFILNPDL